jgi:hypothetical protein
MTEYSHYIQDLETGHFIEAHFMEFPFQKRILMRIHDNKQAFIKDLHDPKIYPDEQDLYR